MSGRGAVASASLSKDSGPGWLGSRLGAFCLGQHLAGPCGRHFPPASQITGSWPLLKEPGSLAANDTVRHRLTLPKPSADEDWSLSRAGALSLLATGSWLAEVLPQESYIWSSTVPVLHTVLPNTSPHSPGGTVQVNGSQHSEATRLPLLHFPPWVPSDRRQLRHGAQDLCGRRSTWAGIPAPALRNVMDFGQKTSLLASVSSTGRRDYLCVAAGCHELRCNCLKQPLT